MRQPNTIQAFRRLQKRSGQELSSASIHLINSIRKFHSGNVHSHKNPRYPNKISAHASANIVFGTRDSGPLCRGATENPEKVSSRFSPFIGSLDRLKRRRAIDSRCIGELSPAAQRVTPGDTRKICKAAGIRVTRWERLHWAR